MPADRDRNGQQDRAHGDAAAEAGHDSCSEMVTISCLLATHVGGWEEDRRGSVYAANQGRTLMDTQKIEQALAASVECDGQPGTLRDYLRTLLTMLWQEEEGFNSKRPFGNSGWTTEVYADLVKAGVLDGEIDEDGYLESVDDGDAEELVVSAIKHIFRAES